MGGGHTAMGGGGGDRAAGRHHACAEAHEQCTSAHVVRGTRHHSDMLVKGPEILQTAPHECAKKYKAQHMHLTEKWLDKIRVCKGERQHEHTAIPSTPRKH